MLEKIYSSWIEPVHFSGSMRTVAILYSTVDGQTKKICEFLVSQLQDEKTNVSLFSINEFHEEVPKFDTIVIGASIRYGKHNETVNRFISEREQELKYINSAFFSVNLVARKAGKDQPETNPYLIKFLDSISWKPDLTDVFAGSLDYSKYAFFDRLMIKAIMKFTKGPTKTEKPIEYTDWERVKAFAQKVRNLNVGMENKLIYKTVD